MQFDQHVVGLLRFRGTKRASEILQSSYLQYALLRKEYGTPEGLRSMGLRRLSRSRLP